MKLLKSIAALALASGLTACAAAPDLTLQAPPFENVASQSANSAAQLLPVGFGSGQINPNTIRVADIRVNVPQKLRVSEANLYYPNADIVWRGDPIGDRRQQIRSIFRTAFAHGTKRFQGDRPVVVDVQLARFHSLSEKARYTVGGVHNIEFHLTVVDARTGAIVMPTRFIELALPAYGGQKAVAADQRGETQKVRVVSYLAHVIDREMRSGGQNSRAQAKKQTPKREPGI